MARLKAGCDVSISLTGPKFSCGLSVVSDVSSNRTKTSCRCRSDKTPSRMNTVAKRVSPEEYMRAKEKMDEMREWQEYLQQHDETEFEFNHPTSELEMFMH